METTKIDSNAKIESHDRTTRLDVDEVAQNLITHLGPTLVAMLANVQDRKLPGRWASKQVVPRHESESRLRTAHRAWTTIATAETDSIARAWFIGRNPLLEERSPIEALREGSEVAVLAAASQFINPE